MALAEETITPAPNAATEDRARWLALYVLCASVLMIVLDGMRATRRR